MSLLFIFNCLEVYGSSSPKVLTPLEAGKFIKKLPAYVGFGYSGLAFYNQKLYVACNIGLLEIEDDIVRKVYQWDKSAITGPWLDLANRQLWIGLQNESVVRFDGNLWQSVSIPSPTNHTLVRGDFLRGYQGFSSSNCFWLVFAGNAWPWEANLRKWNDQIDLPAVKAATRFGHFERLFLLNEKSFIVTGCEPDWKIEQHGHDNSLISDSVQYFDHSWLPVTNLTTTPFFVKQTVSMVGKGFLRTMDGEILQADPSNITKMETPGYCEALAVTSAGTLLACFHNKGVYEFSKVWKLLFKVPYLPTERIRQVYLAESDGLVALATHPESHLKDGKRIQTSSARLWLFNGKELKEIQFPIAPSKK